MTYKEILVLALRRLDELDCADTFVLRHPIGKLQSLYTHLLADLDKEMAENLKVTRDKFDDFLESNPEYAKDLISEYYRDNLE